MNDRHSGSHAVPDPFDPPAPLERFKIFYIWCLQREALRGWNYLLLLTPLLMAGYYIMTFGQYWTPALGTQIQMGLFSIAAFCVVVGGVRHASGAVCWEVSSEMRDLVRLTDLPPTTMIWCKTLGRWWSIGVSLLLLLPLVILSGTLGSPPSNIGYVAACWLILITILTAGFAMNASVMTSDSSNPEISAATGTFTMLLVYNIIFWSAAAFLGFVDWFLQSQLKFSSPLFGQGTLLKVLALAPLTGLFYSMTSPGTFSIVSPMYWVHPLVGGICCFVAASNFKHRLRVTTQGDVNPRDEPSERQLLKTKSAQRSPDRPRCTARPFFWKDTVILDGGRSRFRWRLMSIVALIGVFVAIALGQQLPAGIFALIAVPCIVSVHFDTLLVAEFREQTWNSLMLLPVDPFEPLLAKLHASLWQRKAVLPPLLIATGFAVFENVLVVIMVAVLAPLAAIVLMEVSILNQFYAKSWWIGPLMALIFLGLIFGLIPVWIGLSLAISFMITLCVLSVLICVLYQQIRSRLLNWLEV